MGSALRLPIFLLVAWMPELKAWNVNQVMSTLAGQAPKLILGYQGLMIPFRMA